MAIVERPDVLAATYSVVKKYIDQGTIPTQIIRAGWTIFRSVPVKFIPKPAAGGQVSKRPANEALKPRDGALEGNNRFSGPSYNGTIPPAAALYCVLQQQALVNEVMYYARRGGVANLSSAGVTLRDVALNDKCVLKIVLMDKFLVADLSPHNPGTAKFVSAMESELRDVLQRTQYNPHLNFWHRLVDSDDCSVARGVGLAVAASGFLRGLSVQTVRRSGRSPEEKGDNLVLFGRSMQEIPGLYVDEAFYFGSNSHLEIYPVQGWQ